MSGRVGRDHHPRRDNFQQNHHPRHQNQHSSPSSYRFDERKSGRGKNPPSRHLWVGNLSHHIDQVTLTDEFIRFGELENIAFHPGRSYAFVNFIRDDDAIAALESLQGFNLAGMPLRIEFAKSDKSSAPPRDELYLQHRDEVQPRNRNSAYSPRDSRKRPASPDAYFPDSSRSNERGSDHPTEILWIGFPACLKVDETILRKAFSPFGVIDKITAFPGRTYAFVQFRSLSSACRAKETLQGKLFGNPRVHISFAKKEHAPSASGRRNTGSNAPLSPHFKSTFQAEPSGNLRVPRNVREPEDPNIRDPCFSKMEYGDPDSMRFSRLESPWTRPRGSYEDRRFHEHGPDVDLQQGRQEFLKSPFREGNDVFQDFSPRNFQGKSPFLEDPRNLPEDTYNYHGGKKPKFDSFPHEELPEFPLLNADQDRHVFPGFVPELPLSDESNKPYIPYGRLSENPPNSIRSFGSRHDNWGSSHDTFHSPPPTSSSIPVDRKRITTELHKPGPKEWKWEGTIAKGGTPVCRARCFPVGKVMDFFLPEFIDCTARTGLDMLAKHYYQAACSWVVFFVAASDADMGYYNEFMHYLGEKQRAAVAKLDDRNTLFLVPPSDFSQNVLKIPGKLSISGVVLSLEPSSPTLASHPPENEMTDRGLIYSHADTPYSKLQYPSGPSPISGPYPNMETSGFNNASLQGNNIKTSASSLFPSYGNGSGSIPPYQMENRHDFQPGHPVSRDPTSHPFPVSEGRNNSLSGWGGPEFSRVNYDGATSYSGSSKSTLHEQKLQSSAPSLPPQGGFQHEQHADVVSSLRGLQQRQTTNYTPQSVNPSPFSQLQQQPLQADNMRAYSHAASGGTQGGQEIVNVSGNAQDDGEADPQKRLQATLQLAAALLQQIQGKGP